MNATISFLLLLIAISTAEGLVHRFADGSIGSNSGPENPVEMLFRQKRAFPSASVVSTVGLSQDDIAVIVDEHNKYRRLVQAGNMAKMVWDPQLASSAQAHANGCAFQHSTVRGGAGENIWASRFLSGSIGTAATYSWYSEVNNGYCGCGNGYKQCCGHYSQMVWATTNRVGCGLAICPSIRNAPGFRYLFVCQYSPGGNRMMMANGRMASQAAYQSGTPCQACSSNNYCDSGLCA